MPCSSTPARIVASIASRERLSTMTDSMPCEVQQLREQQTRRPRPDDADLGAHGHLGSPQCLRADFHRRAQAAGIATQIGCHTFRATGITIYLTNGGTLEKAQMMAAHSSPRTTKLYDRTSDAVSLDEVERVVF